MSSSNSGSAAKPYESIHSTSTSITTDKPAAGESGGNRKYLKWAFRIFLLLVIIAIVIVGVLESDRVVAFFEDFLEWVRDAGALGPIVFAGAYAAATILFLPGLILTIGAGFVFAQAFGQGVGLLVASVVVFIGAVAGASAAFVLGRTILREPVSNYAAKNPKFGAVDNAIRDEGLKMVFLLRLSPIVPFNAFNYFAGITSVRFRSYFLASVGMIPGTVVYCFVGTTISNLSEAAGAGITDGGTAPLVLLIVGTILAIASVAFVSWKAKKAINKAVAEAEARRGDQQCNDASDFADASLELEEGGVNSQPEGQKEGSPDYHTNMQQTLSFHSANRTVSSYGSANHTNMSTTIRPDPPTVPLPPLPQTS